MDFKEVALKLLCENSKEIYFLLDENSIKPIFTSHENTINSDFICMLDTGAVIPVWCSGAAQLIDAFPSSVYKPI